MDAGESKKREPRNTREAAEDIATTSIEKSGEIVRGAGDILKGNISGGIGRIIKSATDIATNAAGRGTRILTQRFEKDEGTEKPDKEQKS